MEAKGYTLHLSAGNSAWHIGEDVCCVSQYSILWARYLSMSSMHLSKTKLSLSIYSPACGKGSCCPDRSVRAHRLERMTFVE